MLEVCLSVRQVPPQKRLPEKLQMGKSNCIFTSFLASQTVFLTYLTYAMGRHRARRSAFPRDLTAHRYRDQNSKES